MSSLRAPVMLAVVVVLVGCSSAVEDPRGRRVPVSGIVTLDGEPLKAGRIVLESSQGEGMLKATTAVENGTFQYTAENGPLAGTATVRVFPEIMELEELESALDGDPRAGSQLQVVPIPARYNENSQLTAKIVLDADESSLTLALTSR